MAGLRFVHTPSQNIATGTSAKTVFQYTAPANSGARIDLASISFDGTSPTGAKVLVEILKGSTGGTGTSRNPAKESGHTGSVQGTGKENFTEEPSGGTVVFRELVHPQAGYTAREPIVLNPAESVNIRCTVGTSVNCSPRFSGEE